MPGMEMYPVLGNTLPYILDTGTTDDEQHPKHVPSSDVRPY